jgi:hypothetical protein
VIAYKFLRQGAVAPFTGFHWPGPEVWVAAPPVVEAWIHACRHKDLSYWLGDELWRIELEAPMREERYQVASPRARLLERVTEWNPDLGVAYARSCALHAMEGVLPQLAPDLQRSLAGLEDLTAIADAAKRATPASMPSAFLADAALWALRFGPGPASYAAVRLVTSTGGGLASFEAERAWQAAWLTRRLGLEGDLERRS